MKKEILVTSVYDWLKKQTAKTVLLKGGAGSSKSHSLAQFFILNKMLPDKDLVNVVARKTLPALKKTAYKLILDLLDDYGIPYQLNKTDLALRVGKSLTYFLSLDDPEKIKSLDINNVFLEEATDFSLSDFRQFRLRLRRKNKERNQIFLSFNPVSAMHWIKTSIADDVNEDVAIHTSTYKNNRFLGKDYIKDLKGLINKDKNFYNVYALGKWGVLENIIYDNWISNPKIEKEMIKDITFGVDWGYSSEASLVKVYWFNDDKVIAKELLYEAGLTTEELLTRAKDLIPEELRHKEVYAGTDEPGSIETFFKAGFNIHKAVTNVRDGINYCKDHLIGFIGENIIKEAQGYKRKQDKEDNVLEEPVKFRDHALDAFRYGCFSAARHYQSADTLESSFR